MKAYSTIRKHVRELRKLVDTHPDPIVRRVAYESETLLRWAAKDVEGWESPARSAQSTAAIIRQEMGLPAPAAAKERV